MNVVGTFWATCSPTGHTGYNLFRSFLCVFRTLGLEYEYANGNSLGSEIGRRCIFSNGKYSVSKKMSAYYLPAHVFFGLVATSYNCFFLLYVFHIVVAFSVLIYFSLQFLHFVYSFCFFFA